MSKNIIKKPAPTDGQRIRIQVNDKPNPTFDYPTFCFKHLHKKHHLDKCTDKEKVKLIEKIVKLSQMTWLQIQQSDKHGMGSEKIAISSITTSLPITNTADVDFLIALRFDKMKPIVGHKGYNNVFHVYFIDRDFTLYNH